MKNVIWVFALFMLCAAARAAGPTSRVIVKLRYDAATAARSGDFTIALQAGAKSADAKLTPVFRVPTSGDYQETFYRLEMGQWFALNASDLSLDMVLNEVRRHPEVAYAAPQSFLEIHAVPNDFSIKNMWGLSKMECPAAWDLDHGNSSILLCVIDTGCKIQHGDLAANVWINPGEDLNGNGIWDGSDNNGIDDDGNGYIDDLTGWDFVSVVPDTARWATGEDYGPRDNLVYPDIHGHGTHTGGTAAAVTGNNLGVAAASWNVKLMPLRAGYAWVNGGGFLQGEGDDVDFAAAVQYAVDNGARIISISFGGVASDSTLSLACQYARANDVLVFASAGNSNNQTMQYPANYPGVISVAATDSFDVKASFSSYGSWVDLSAPGVHIWSTMSNSSYSPGDYLALNGTSMACPNAASVAALLLNFYPDLTADSIEAILFRTADNIDAQNPTRIGLLGHGRVNAFRALAEACLSNPLYSPQIVAQPLVTGVKLAWRRVPCANSYEVFSADSLGGLYQTLTTTADTSYTDPAGNLRRYYSVIAHN